MSPNLISHYISLLMSEYSEVSSCLSVLPSFSFSSSLPVFVSIYPYLSLSLFLYFSLSFYLSLSLRHFVNRFAMFLVPLIDTLSMSQSLKLRLINFILNTTIKHVLYRVYIICTLYNVLWYYPI